MGVWNLWGERGLPDAANAHGAAMRSNLAEDQSYRLESSRYPQQPKRLTAPPPGTRPAARTLRAVYSPYASRLPANCMR